MPGNSLRRCDPRQLGCVPLNRTAGMNTRTVRRTAVTRRILSFAGVRSADATDQRTPVAVTFSRAVTGVTIQFIFETLR